MSVTRNAKGDQKAMLKMRRATVAFLGVLVLSALATSSASAGWFIEGVELSAGSKAALATTAKVVETSTLLVPALGLSVVCGGGTLDGTSPEIIGVNTLKASALKFLSCNTTAPASGCALQEKNQTIATVALKVTGKEAVYPADRLLVAPQTKSTLTEIAFNEANTCAFNGLEPVKGLLTLNASTLQEEHAEQPIEGLGSTENNSLEIGAGNKAFIDRGKISLTLTTGSEFVGLLGTSSVNVGLDMPTNGKLTFAAKNAEGTIEYKNNEPMMVGSKDWSTSEGDITDGGEYTITNNECATKLVLKPQEKCKFKVKLTVNPTGKTRLFFVHEAPIVSLKS